MGALLSCFNKDSVETEDIQLDDIRDIKSSNSCVNIEEEFVPTKEVPVADTGITRINVATTEDASVTVATTEDSSVTVATTEDASATVATTEDASATGEQQETRSTNDEDNLELETEVLPETSAKPKKKPNPVDIFQVTRKKTWEGSAMEEAVPSTSSNKKSKKKNKNISVTQVESFVQTIEGWEKPKKRKRFRNIFKRKTKDTEEPKRLTRSTWHVDLNSEEMKAEQKNIDVFIEGLD